MSDIPINIMNFTMDNRNLKKTCELNALEMIDNINKMPEIAFWFLVGALLLLTIYLFWIDKSNNEIIKNYFKKGFLILPYLSLIVATYLYMFITFNIDSQAFFKVVEPTLYIITGLLLIKIIYDEHKRGGLKILWDALRKGNE